MFSQCLNVDCGNYGKPAPECCRKDRLATGWEPDASTRRTTRVARCSLVLCCMEEEGNTSVSCFVNIPRCLDLTFAS